MICTCAYQRGGIFSVSNNGLFFLPAFGYHLLLDIKCNEYLITPVVEVYFPTLLVECNGMEFDVDLGGIWNVTIESVLLNVVCPQIFILSVR